MSEIIVAVTVAPVFFILGIVLCYLLKSRQMKEFEQMAIIHAILQEIDCANELRQGNIENSLETLESMIYMNLVVLMDIPNNKDKKRPRHEKESKYLRLVWEEAKKYFNTYGIDTIRKDAMQGGLAVDWFEMFQQKITGNNALPAPALEIAAWLDGPTSLEQLRGKVVLLNFWDMEHETCPDIKPNMQNFKDKYGDRGLEIISIHTPCKDDAPVIEFFSKHSYTFRKAIASSETSSAYQIRNIASPTFFLINKSGNIVGIPRDKLPAASLIEELLAG